jgi:putative acetyltransferase
MPLAEEELSGGVLRRARESDVSELARLYSASVRALAPGFYPPESVIAWAAFAEDPGFRDFVLAVDTLVVEDSSGLIGFAGLDQSGRITSLYVRPDRTRKGVGSRLLSTLLGSSPRPLRFWTQASTLSRPLFERFGFVVVETEVVERHGAKLERYVMERRS